VTDSEVNKKRSLNFLFLPNEGTCQLAVGEEHKNQPAPEDLGLRVHSSMLIVLERICQKGAVNGYFWALKSDEGQVKREERPRGGQELERGDGKRPGQGIVRQRDEGWLGKQAGDPVSRIEVNGVQCGG